MGVPLSFLCPLQVREMLFLFIALLLVSIWLSTSNGMERFSECEQELCLPGERDEGDFCVSKGCPPGFEQGKDGKRCYPLCLDGYDSDGASQCYKACPPDYQQSETMCVKPSDRFAKDVVPCRGCIGPPPEEIFYVEPASVGPVIMTPGAAIIEAFGDEGPDTKVTVNLREPRIDEGLSPCPRGYALSGDLCYENCPPKYHHEKQGQTHYCVRGEHAFPRQSYSRGDGIPIERKRRKRPIES